MKPKQFHYILIGLMAVFCLVVVVVAYSFFNSVIRTSNNLIIANSSENQLDLRISALQRLSGQLQTIQGPLAALAGTIPSNQDVSGLIADLEQLGDQSNVHIASIDFSAPVAPAAPATTAPVGDSSISSASSSSSSTTAPTSNSTATATDTPQPLGPKVPAGITTLPFKMEASGSYASMVSFINQLPQLPRLVTTTQLTLTKQHKETDNVTVDFVAQAYEE